MRYSVRVKFSGRRCRIFEMMPMFFEALLIMISVCLCHFKSADKITPRNFDSSCFCSETLSIIMLADRFFLPKIMNVVLETLSERRFAWNQRFTNLNSLFKQPSTSSIVFPVVNKLVSSWVSWV